MSKKRQKIHVLRDEHGKKMIATNDVHEMWAVVRCDYGPLSERPDSFDALGDAIADCDLGLTICKENV